LLASLWAEGVRREQVVVLFPHRPSQTRESELRALGLLPYRPEHAEQQQATYAVVSGFKGLESDVVVFAGGTELESEWSRAVAYVAMSRARVRLCLLLAEDLKPL